jgi:hypothetical protein
VPSESTLTLFIPDLFGFQSTLNHLSPEEKSSLPKFEIPILEKWLSLGSFEKSSNQEENVFLELGLGEYKNKDKPFAALSLLAEKVANVELNTKSYWLRADPVNLQPDRDTALMAGHEELALTQDEADKLVAQINEHFVDEPWQLYAFSPHRWYLRLDKPANLITTPLLKVLGNDINLFSPMGDDADYWFKITNELQMLIHGSNVNFERDSRNMWTANSVWLWGGGCLPEVNLNSYYDKIITNNLIYSGIGYHCGFDVLPLKPVVPLNNTFSENIKTNNNLVVLDMLSEQVQRRDLYTFVQTLNKLEENYFNPCNDLLAKGSLREIKLITDAGILVVTKKQLGRWWKWSKSFSSFNYE